MPEAAFKREARALAMVAAARKPALFSIGTAVSAVLALVLAGSAAATLLIRLL